MEETRESGGGAALDGRGADGSRAVQLPAAAYRLLPPFLLKQEWLPDAYDEVVLEWWGEAYLMECGTLHADERLAQHDHGDVLALVVVEEWKDWVEEALEATRPVSPSMPRDDVLEARV